MNDNINRFGRRGFSLIELLIAVAIVAILAAIALPSYKEYVNRGRRADAQAVLVEAAQWMERYYSQNSNYDVSATDFTNSGMTASPKSAAAGTRFYTITLTTLPAGETGSSVQQFQLTATKANAMANDRCANFVINSVGQKLTDPASGVNCWSK